MKYICKICGQIIDNDQICPFCGSDASKIEPYEEKETKKYRCLNCGHELQNNDSCPFCGANSSMIFDENSEVTVDDTTSIEMPTAEEEKPVFEYCEGDNCGDSEETNNSIDEPENQDNQFENKDEYKEELSINNLNLNEEKPENERLFAQNSQCNECNCDNCSQKEDTYFIEDEISDLLIVLGHLYKTDFEKYKKFKEYLDNYLLSIAIDLSGEIDVKDSLEELKKDPIFKEIIKQFK